MLFSFALGGTQTAQLAKLEDALRPLFSGLRRTGQRVISFAHGLAPPPAINVLVAHEGADIGRRLSEGRREIPGARIGVVCAEAIDDATAASADFIWTLGPAAAFDGIVAAERCAAIEYGFDPVMLGRRVITDAARRDTGLVVYGPKTAYRNQIVERLKAAGLAPFLVENGRFPEYIASDLLSRAKLIVVTRDSEADQVPAGGRLAKAVCSGAAVVAEAAASGACPLAPYVTICSVVDLSVRCRELFGDGRVVELGLAGFERFRTETSMAEGVAAALRVPAVVALREA